MHVLGLEETSVMEAHVAAQVKAIDVSLLEHFPFFGQAGSQLRAFAVMHEIRVHALGEVAERGGADVNGIHGQLLPQHRRHGERSTVVRRGKGESVELLIEQVGLVTECARHLAEIGDRHVALARGLLDDGHRLHDGRALSGQDGARRQHVLHEPHDVLHGSADGAAAGLLLVHGAFEMLRVVADRGGLFADLARGLRLLLRGGRSLLHHLGDFLDGGRGCSAAAGLLFRGSCDLGDGAGRARREVENLVEHLRGTCGQPDAVADAVRADGHLFRGALNRSLHVQDERTDLVGGDRGALGKVADLVGDDGKALAPLAGLRGDDRGIEGQEVRLSGDLVDDAHDLADFLRALGQLAQRHLGFVDRLLDAAHAVDGATDSLAAFVGGVFDVARQLARLFRRLADLLGGGVHLHHRAGCLNGERREALGVRGHFVDRGDHLLDGRARLFDEL